MVLGTATAAIEEAPLEAPLAWAGFPDTGAEEAEEAAWDATGTAPAPVAEVATAAAEDSAVVEGLTVVTTGFMVEEVTVERAGQSVTEAAHEVMVSHSVE